MRQIGVSIPKVDALEKVLRRWSKRLFDGCAFPEVRAPGLMPECDLEREATSSGVRGLYRRYPRKNLTGIINKDRPRPGTVQFVGGRRLMRRPQAAEEEGSGGIRVIPALPAGEASGRC
jgi:hypothetical protein